MNPQIYREIPISEVRPSPFNPRKNFKGRKFDELIKSIAAKGVIEPILVRPIEEAFEIVAGERRFRALKIVAAQNGGPEKCTIPALVRELNDDEAFDLMTIENLQREDLTELEEAEGFKAYLDRRGKDALTDLAERTAIHPGYIRKRVAVLELPKRILKAWEDGHLRYGHLEQLLRVQNKKARGKWCSELLNDIKMGWADLTVAKLKHSIDNDAPSLKDARFDREKAGCVDCQHNSDVQKKLFDIDSSENAVCLNSKCFKQQTNNHFIANWKKTGHFKKNKTTGFRFHDDVGHSFHIIWQKTPKKCLTCDHFVTIIDMAGSKVYDRACIGDSKCFNDIGKSKSGKPEERDPDAPRVSWHGEYFREKFYQQALPERFKREMITSVDNPDAVEKKERLALFALLKSNRDLHAWLAEKLELKDGEGGYRAYFGFGDKKLFFYLEKMTFDMLLRALEGATLQVILQSQFGADGRRLVADHLGIDLKAEFRIDEEYLKKKTKAEILAIGEQFGVFEQDAAKTFLFEVFLKKRGSFKSCKKDELIRVFTESGVDLAGVVPDEIVGEQRE